MNKEIDNSLIDDLLSQEESLRFDEWSKEYAENYPQRDLSLVTKPVNQIMRNINEDCKSFVVYGEPQSGKTETMIALSCKLFDEGVNTIFVLMHDIKTLQSQNFQERFLRNEHFRVTPILADEFIKTDTRTRTKKNWLIFGRKNSNQLEKLIHETRMLSNKVIIDDEADYATPDTKINKEESEASTINRLMTNLVGESGYYVGVTATPGRLDVNNTLYNEADKWVFCDPGEGYTGVSYFFPEDPTEIDENYTLTLINPDVEYKEDLEKAIFRFMARNAHMNIVVNDKPVRYSMVIHTSRKITDHKQDRDTVQNIVDILQGNDVAKKRRIFERILEQVEKIYPLNGEDNLHHRKIMEFIRDKSKASINLYTLNSKNDLNNNIIALKAPDQFTFVFGGNTLSRGITFENMLSFYFARSVKKQLQQNTYVQMARHFGYRKNTGKAFELTVPEDIWEKWYSCFSSHEVSLDTAKAGDPLWIKTSLSNPVDSASIDRANVIAGNDGTLAFAKFKLTHEIEDLFCNKTLNPLEKLIKFNSLTQDECFPRREIDRIKSNVEDPSRSVDVIVSKNNLGELRDITNQTLTDEEYENISRKRGSAPGTNEMNIKNAYCYVLPYKNSITGEGRIHYTKNKTISYLKNMRSS